MENNFIQMAASSSHTLTYTIGPIFEHIIDCVQLYFPNTYIIGHYNPSVRIIDLVSHTTSVVGANFIHKWRDLQFKLGYERQIFEQLFMANFIYFSDVLPEIF